MRKYKVCVYAISKNEEQFVKRWYESVKEADEIYVLDTGSSDNTVSLLKELGVNVTSKIINPWRFDVARNEALNLVPMDTDICVCIDLDEVFEEGWRTELENIWDTNTNRVRYNYNWSLDKFNKPLVNFYIEKIHSRKNYIWTHPVHEILKYTKGTSEVFKTTDQITVNHYPDSTKSRSNYLPLLELSVRESPNDDRNMHYLGREYMYYGRWNEAIDTLIKHLKMKESTWKDERGASMRFIARCYQNLNRYDEAEMWLEKAINETPYLRDPFVEMALLKYHLQKWNEVEYYCKKSLEITKKQKSYINEEFSWNYTIYDLLSLSYFYQGKLQLSHLYVTYATELAPDNERLKSNKELIKALMIEKA